MAFPPVLIFNTAWQANNSFLTVKYEGGRNRRKIGSTFVIKKKIG